MLGAHEPSLPHLRSHTHSSPNSRWCSWESKLPLFLSHLPAGFSMACLARHPSPEEVGTHWQPSRCSPSHPRTYIWTHTNTETQKLVDRLTALAPTTPHPAGHWPMDRGHVAGQNASRCWALAPTDLVPACLPANYQPGTTHKNREGVLFSSLLIAAIALLSAPLGFWPLLAFLLAFLMAVVGYRICSSFYSLCCFCCSF